MSAEPIDYRTHLAVALPLQRGASNKYEPSRQQSLHQPLPKGRDGVELLRMHAGARRLFSNLLHSQVTSSAGVLSKMQIRRQMLLSNYCLSYRFKLRIFASKCRKTDEKKKKRNALFVEDLTAFYAATEKLIILPKDRPSFSERLYLLSNGSSARWNMWSNERAAKQPDGQAKGHSIIFQHLSQRQSGSYQRD